MSPSLNNIDTTNTNPSLSKLPILINEISLEPGHQYIEVVKNPTIQTDFEFTISTNNFQKTINLNQEQLINTIELSQSERLNTDEVLELRSSNDQLIDSVCFYKNLEPINHPNNWLSECVNTNGSISIYREHFFDTNTSQDWQTSNTPSPNSLTPALDVPTANIKVESGSTQAVKNLELTVSTINTPDQIYQWYINSIPYSTLTTPPEIKITNLGQHELKLVTTSKDKLTSTAYLTLTVLPDPIINPCSSIITDSNNPAATSTTNQSSNVTVQAVQSPASQPQASFNSEDYKFLRISNIFPNPETGSEEWVELSNNGPTDLTLNDWQLDDIIDGGSKPYVISNLTIKANSTSKLFNNETKVSLNNGGDTVNLIDPLGNVHDQLSYETSSKNEIIAPNNQTTVTKLTPQKTTTTKIANKSATSVKSVNQNQTSNTIRLTEIYPNPKGTDAQQEWIEIQNFGLEQVDIQNWQLQVNSKSFKFNKPTIIAAQSNHLLKQSELNFDLPNKETTIQLIDSNGTIKQSLSYQSAPEEQTYSYLIDQRQQLHASTIIRQNYNWLWLTESSPGELNPVLKTLSGQIAAISPNENTITIKHQNLTELISYNSSQLPIPQLKTLTPNHTLTANTLSNLNHNQLLEIIKIENTPKTKTGSPQKVLLYIIVSLISIITITMLFRKRLKLAFKHLVK